jgi:hypothetical protein
MISFLQYLDHKYYLYYKRHLNCRYHEFNEKIIEIAKKYLQLTAGKTAGVKKKKRRKKIIVSLTSIPSRMDSLYYTLLSIFNQTIKPDFIILYLAKDEFVDEYRIPKNIRQLQQKGLQIRYVDNLKSHKKYYYTMMHYPNDLTLTLDDDIIYSEKLIQNLIEEYRKRPESIICSRSRIVTRINGEIMKYNSWKCIDECDKDVEFKREDIFFTTGGGTLFPNWKFSKETFDLDKIMSNALLADDVWLNYMARLNKINIYNTVSNDCHCLFNCENQDFALADYNMGKNGNDICIDNMSIKYGIKL